MYSRPLNKIPEKIVHNGKIHFGSYQGVTDRLDIRGVRAPFAGVPIGRLFSNFRIKSKIIYSFCYEKYAGIVEFFDDKAFGLAEVSLWNRETNQKYSYHTFMGPRKRFVPTNTKEAACTSFSKSRYIKISWSRKHKHVKLSFVVKGDRFRPAFKGKFYSPFDIENSSGSDSDGVLFVNPAPTTQRCSATWILPLEILGGVGTAPHRKQITCLPEAKGLGLLLINRTYLKVHSTNEIMFGLFQSEDKRISFSFSNTNQDSIDDDTYNNNVLSVNGQITAMPPVKITHPFGINGKWVIQDTENMVDLSFFPVTVSSRTVNIIVMRNMEKTIFGNFEGILMSKDGEKITLKNCPGIVKKSMLRL
ncbi:MAG: DUF2804 domain-containing protein [Treponema sp.]|nr:DUF2804 domain-containing protein [Treponema sp.]